MSQAVYRPRDPQNPSYCQFVQDHFEAFEQAHDERLRANYDFFRPYVKQVIYR
jgi:hypothetical protein